MKGFPLQLSRSTIDRLLIEADPEYVAGSKAIGLAVGIGLQSSEDGKQWVAKIDVEVGPNETGEHPRYRIAATVVGHFVLEAAFPTGKEAATFVGRNAASVLFSGLRELVGLVTSRARSGTLVLPIVTFSDYQAEPDREVPEAAGTKSKGPKPSTKRVSQPKGTRKRSSKA